LSTLPQRKKGPHMSKGGSREIGTRRNLLEQKKGGEWEGIIEKKKTTEEKEKDRGS